MQCFILHVNCCILFFNTHYLITSNHISMFCLKQYYMMSNQLTICLWKSLIITFIFYIGNLFEFKLSTWSLKLKSRFVVILRYWVLKRFPFLCWHLSTTCNAINGLAITIFSPLPVNRRIETLSRKHKNKNDACNQPQ